MAFDDEDIDIHVHHGGPPPPRPVRFVRVQSPPRPRYHQYDAGPRWLGPEQRTTVIARSASRSRSRSHDRRGAPQAQPVIINDNRVFRDYSSSSEDEYLGRRPRRRRSSSSKPRPHADLDAEFTRRELERLRIKHEREISERRMEKEFRDEAELLKAKKELNEIKRREALAAEEERIKKELERERLLEEQRAAEEAERRKKEAKEAVELYKQQEIKRMAKEAKEREEREKEYQRRLQEDLLRSGVDEKAITAIMKKEKVPEAEEQMKALVRPTYMRMARKHLSIETLRVYHIDWDYDTVRLFIPGTSGIKESGTKNPHVQDPDYVIIKRLVSNEEQDVLWRHTRHLRKKRGKALLEDESRFEFVRKSSRSRKRSKSPGLLMYLAGARPA